MSGKGNYDNAVMARCFLNLTMKRVWQTLDANHQEAFRDISRDVVAFYNACCLNSSLGYMPPNQFDANLTEIHQNTSIEVSS